MKQKTVRTATTSSTHFNPIVDEVLDQFKTIEYWSSAFTNRTNPTDTRGLLISGDAGMGKTYWVQKGLYANVDKDDVSYIKGSSVTAASLFLKLFLNKEQGKVLVLDDVDIIHKSPAEMNTILDLLKGATEMTYGERMLSWDRVAPPKVFKECGADKPFDFQGTIIWITNDTIEEIAKRGKGHWPAISSRFTQVRCRFDNHQKLQYTLHLLTEEDILGKNNNVREGGHTQEVIDLTINFVRRNWGNLSELTPRTMHKIADIIQSTNLDSNRYNLILEHTLFTNN
jgi:hypothetical protein